MYVCLSVCIVCRYVVELTDRQAAEVRFEQERRGPAGCACKELCR